MSLDHELDTNLNPGLQNTPAEHRFTSKTLFGLPSMDAARVVISTPFYTAYQFPNNRVAVVPSSEITATDAELSRHPSTEARQEDTVVNHLEVADEEAKADWKKKLGALVAKNLIKAAVETDGKTCK